MLILMETDAVWSFSIADEAVKTERPEREIFLL